MSVENLDAGSAHPKILGLIGFVESTRDRNLNSREKSLLEAFGSAEFFERLAKAVSLEQNFEIWDRQKPLVRWQGNFPNIDFRDTIIDITSLPQFRMGRPLLALVALHPNNGEILKPTTEDLFKLANINTRTKASRNTVLIVGKVSDDQAELILLREHQNPSRKYRIRTISKELRSQEEQENIIKVLKDYYQADYLQIPMRRGKDGTNLAVFLTHDQIEQILAFA